MTSALKFAKRVQTLHVYATTIHGRYDIVDLRLCVKGLKCKTYHNNVGARELAPVPNLRPILLNLVVVALHFSRRALAKAADHSVVISSIGMVLSRMMHYALSDI